MGAINNVGKILNGKKIGFSGMVSVGINTYLGVTGYKERRSQGKGKVGAAIETSADLIMMESMGFGLTIGLQAARAIPKLAVNGYMKMGSMARSMDRMSINAPFANSTFSDSKQAYTMRQAGMQLAEVSKYNLQQTLMGNEASSMHIV